MQLQAQRLPRRSPPQAVPKWEAPLRNGLPAQAQIHVGHCAGCSALCMLHFACKRRAVARLRAWPLRQTTAQPTFDPRRRPTRGLSRSCRLASCSCRRAISADWARLPSSRLCLPCWRASSRSCWSRLMSPCTPLARSVLLPYWHVDPSTGEHDGRAERGACLQLANEGLRV